MEEFKERILCSAIWYQDQPTAHLLPVNVDRGVVVCGLRHPHCIYTINALLGTRMCEQGTHIQGFLTNTNRFVDRKEAKVIAIAANQLIGNTHPGPGTGLFSEDLY